jgi:hypothetical protein
MTVYTKYIVRTWLFHVALPFHLAQVSDIFTRNSVSALDEQSRPMAIAHATGFKAAWRGQGQGTPPPRGAG